MLSYRHLDVQYGRRTRHPKDFEHMSWNFINTLDSEEEESGSEAPHEHITDGQSVSKTGVSRIYFITESPRTLINFDQLRTHPIHIMLKDCSFEVFH